MPWWLFAFFAAIFAPLTLEFYDGYQRDQERVEEALMFGPPDAVQLSQFSRRYTGEPFGEVRIEGTLRADLGINSVTFSETVYNYVLLDDKGGGPLIAIMVRSADADAALTSLVNAADRDGRLTVQGFLAPNRVGEVSRRLAQQQGISRELFVVEPFFGDRTAALNGKVEDSQLTFFITLGITVFFAFMAVWRFRRWRKRRVAKRQARGPQSAPAPQMQSAPPQRAASSPWGSFEGGIGNARPQAAAPKPAAPVQAKPAAKLTPKKQPKKQPKQRKPSNTPAQPAFESVFPGGASSFRFKSADEIIRQKFGTAHSQSRLNVKD